MVQLDIFCGKKTRHRVYRCWFWTYFFQKQALIFSFIDVVLYNCLPPRKWSQFWGLTAISAMFLVMHMCVCVCVCVELRVLRMRVTTPCPHAVGDAWGQPLPLAHLMHISHLHPNDQDLLFKLHDGNIEEITRAGGYMTTIQAQCANLCAAMSVRVEVLLFRSGVIGHVSRPIADPTVEPQDFLRKCLKCGKVAYLRKNGCANPDCVTWLRINKSVLSHIGERWKRRPWRLQDSHTYSPLHPGAESRHGEQMGRPKNHHHLHRCSFIWLFAPPRKKIANFWGLSAKLTRFSWTIKQWILYNLAEKHGSISSWRAGSISNNDKVNDIFP